MSTPAFTLLRLALGCGINVGAVMMGLAFWLFYHDRAGGLQWFIGLALLGWTVLPDMAEVKRINAALLDEIERLKL